MLDFALFINPPFCLNFIISMFVSKIGQLIFKYGIYRKNSTIHLLSINFFERLYLIFGIGSIDYVNLVNVILNTTFVIF